MKRTVTLSLILVCGIVINTFGQLCTLTGTITGFKQQSFVLWYSRDGEPVRMDTIYVNNDKFAWSGKASRPISAMMIFEGAGVPIFLEPVKMTINGRADSLSQLKITGSKTTDEMVAFTTRTKPLSEKIAGINSKLRGNNAQNRQSLKNQREQLEQELHEITKQHIETHPKSYFSLKITSITVLDSYQKASQYYNLLDKSILNNDMAVGLVNRLKLSKRREVGEQIPNFVQNDANDKAVSFFDFKGKYVLIDFWASWCGPCRAENPNVLSAYNKFKDKGFTVIGVSLDEKKENWVNAVKDDKMPWTQVSDLKGWKNELSSYYGIGFIPSNLLVDPDGKIIAKDLRGEDLHEKLAKLF